MSPGTIILTDFEECSELNGSDNPWTMSLDRPHDPTMGNVLERFVVPGTQRRDEVAPWSREMWVSPIQQHEAIRSLERTGLEASEGGERYSHSVTSMSFFST